MTDEQGTPQPPQQPGPPPGYGQPPAPPPGYGQAPGWGTPPPPPPPGYGTPPGQYGGQYAPPGYYGGGYAPPRTDSKAIVALVLAIASFVVCPVVPAIVAIVLANQSLNEIRMSGGAVGGEGMANAARVISWLHLGLVLLAFVLIAILAAAAPR